MTSIYSELISGVTPAQQVEQWTLFIPPQLDLLGSGSWVTVEAAHGFAGDALASYRASSTTWRRVARMRSRSHNAYATRALSLRLSLRLNSSSSSRASLERAIFKLKSSCRMD